METRAQISIQRPRCPYCHDDVRPGTGVGCTACMGWVHPECWDEHGACPTCAAQQAAEERAAAVRTPGELFGPRFWGLLGLGTAALSTLFLVLVLANGQLPRPVDTCGLLGAAVFLAAAAALGEGLLRRRPE